MRDPIERLVRIMEWDALESRHDFAYVRSCGGDCKQYPLEHGNGREGDAISQRFVHQNSLRIGGTMYDLMWDMQSGDWTFTDKESGKTCTCKTNGGDDRSILVAWFEANVEAAPKGSRPTARATRIR